MGCGIFKKNKIFVNNNPTTPIKTEEILPNKAPVKKLPEDQLISPGRIIIKNTSKLERHYTLSVKIADSSHGEIRVGNHIDTGQKRTVKRINKEGLKSIVDTSRFLAELELYKTLDHPNIVTLLEYFEDETCYYIVREFLAGGELFEYVLSREYLSESIAVHFVKQILSALVYIHSKGIVHGDLKPENIMLDKEGDDAIIKIIGFDTSVAMKKTGSAVKSSSLIYKAPEILKNEAVDEKSDMWSLGIVLYILISGRDPFYGDSEEEIKSRIISCKYSFLSSEWDNVSSDCKNLIKKLLHSNPSKRISASQALQSPWVNNNSRKSTPAKVSTIGLQNLRRFYAEKKLQYIFLTYIVNHLLSKEETNKLYEKFKALDKDSDGKLSREELIEAYLSVMGKEEAINEARRIMELVDVDGSGYIDYSEFITACAKSEVLLCKKNLENTFKAFDIDQNGKISGPELKEMLGKIGGDDEVISKLIAQVDLNGDGSIDFDEFVKLMQECITRVQIRI